MSGETAGQKNPLTFVDILTVAFAAAGFIGGGLLALRSSESIMQL
jgi:hypothetical protein